MPMNIRVPAPVRTTQAAEGLPRRAFTVAEVERMVDIGLLAEDERVELIGGELVPMSPKGIRHETLKAALLRAWYRACPDHLQLIPETTFRLSGDTFVEPDLIVYRTRTKLSELRGDTVLLAVEIAESSLRFDLGRKASLYAAHGIGELWVIDARRLVIHVHRAPGPYGYGSVTVLDAAATAVPAAAPELTLRLSGLDLSDLDLAE
jgi:Uma2 family endonuclease